MARPTVCTPPTRDRSVFSFDCDSEARGWTYPELVDLLDENCPSGWGVMNIGLHVRTTSAMISVSGRKREVFQVWLLWK